MSFYGELGFLDAVVRGFENSLLTNNQYQALLQCSSMTDFASLLSSTDYAPLLADEPKVTSEVLRSKCMKLLVKQFKILQSSATGNLVKLLDFYSYAHMIDNLVLILSGAADERDPLELVEHCHPLGMFDALPAACVASTSLDLYNVALIDSPLALFFSRSLTAADLDQLDIEVIRNSLFKAYIESFHEFASGLDEHSTRILCSLIEIEADRRLLNITVNSLGTALNAEDRLRLFPSVGFFGKFMPDVFAKAEDMEQIINEAEKNPLLSNLFDQISAGKSLDDFMQEIETSLCREAFDCQAHLGVFYAYLKLREQETNNLVWIADCVEQNLKSGASQLAAGFG